VIFLNELLFKVLIPIQKANNFSKLALVRCEWVDLMVFLQCSACEFFVKTTTSSLCDTSSIDDGLSLVHSL